MNTETAKKLNVVVLDSGYKSYQFERELFEQNGAVFKVYPSYTGHIKDKLEFARGAHGLLVRHTIIDSAFLSEMKNLKAIVRYGVGYDNIDVAACTRYGVKVANVQGYASHSVSEHALALMLTCSRGMWDTRMQVTAGFAAPPAEDVFELHDKTLGIIGLGRIGSELAKKAIPLFGNVIASDPYKPEELFRNLHVQKITLKELLEKSDVISINCNLTSETNHMLNEKAFSSMKRKPVVINTARGQIIDEKALLKALQENKIHSAGLDVYENEPVTPLQESLINHPRTICTGHYAWYSERASRELQKRAALNLNNLLNGTPVEDCLNP